MQDMTSAIEVRITEQGHDVLDLADADRALTAIAETWTIEMKIGDGSWLVTLPTSLWTEVQELGGVVLQAGQYQVEIPV
jgi:hypothetical protein